MPRFLCAVTVLASLTGIPVVAQLDQPQNGYASAVTDAATIATVTARFQKDMSDMGIQATVTSCRHIERVSVGVRNGDNAYGAACDLAVANAKPKTLLLCDDDFGENFSITRRSFVNTQEWMEGYVRKNCF